MPPDRDVLAFERRAATYEQGWLGRLHHEIAERAAALAVTFCPDPHRVLDVGCGTGYLLRELAVRYPRATHLSGIDPAPSMIEVANRSVGDQRPTFTTGVVEHLPYPGSAFDLVVSTTSFDHWADQRRGLRECARVLVPGGQMVLVDQFSLLLTPTLVASRRGKARTKGKASQLLEKAGFTSLVWHDLDALIIKAVTAVNADVHGHRNHPGCTSPVS